MSEDERTGAGTGDIGDTGDTDAADAALLAELRALAEVDDPVPPALAEAARAAYGWRTLEDELAALTFDSLLDDPAVLVRGAGVVEERLLTFTASYVTVDLQVTGSAAGRLRLIGQLEPAGPAQVRLRWPGGEVLTEADELGRVAPVEVPAGPLCLRVRVVGMDNWVTTEWTVV